jgi:hypothetical protein
MQVYKSMLPRMCIFLEICKKFWTNQALKWKIQASRSCYGYKGKNGNDILVIKNVSMNTEELTLQFCRFLTSEPDEY